MKHGLKAFVVTLFLSSTLAAQGTVIFLNGTSSAGKTAISEELEKSLEVSWEEVAFDNFARIAIKNFAKEKTGVILNLNDEIAEKELDGLVQAGKITWEEVNEFSEEKFYFILNLLLQKTEEHLQSGKNVIIDTINVEADFKHYFEALHQFNVIFILVYCPVTTLVERIIKRNKEGDERDFASVLRHFGRVYKAAQPGDAPILGTLTKTEIKNIFEQHAKKEFGTEKEYNKVLSEMLKNLSFDRQESIQVTPRLKHDLVVNTGELSTQEASQKIKQFMETKTEFTAFKENVQTVKQRGWFEKIKYWVKKRFVVQAKPQFNWRTKKQAFLLRG